MYTYARIITVCTFVESFDHVVNPFADADVYIWIVPKTQISVCVCVVRFVGCENKTKTTRNINRTD